MSLFNASETEFIDYEELSLEKEIGRGSFGIVYQALYMGTPVAVKQITPELNEEMKGLNMMDSQTQGTLAREVNVLKSLRHPNIIFFLGLAEHNKKLYLVTEFVNGGNLHTILNSKEIELPWSLRSKLILDVASAMTYLHTKNVIFRDLKTENILVETSSIPWKAKLCDFGFARPTDGMNQRPMTMCGTDDWMAPEVILGLSYGVQADVFSFGMIILEAVIRQRVSDVLVRRPQDAFAVDLDKARALFPRDVDMKLANIGLECCIYEPELRPSFKNIVQKLTDNIVKSYATSASKAARKSINITAEPLSPLSPPLSLSQLSISNESGTSPVISRTGQEKIEDLRKVLAEILKQVQMKLVKVDLEMEDVNLPEHISAQKGKIKSLIQIKKILEPFPLNEEDDSYEEKNYDHVTDAKIAVFKKHIDYTLWSIRSKIYEVKVEVDGTESVSNLVDLARVVKKMKAVIAEM